MKPLNEYPTPECDRRAEDCEDSCGNPFEAIDSDLGRSLEQRLAACREVLESAIPLLRGSWNQDERIKYVAIIDETLTATKTP